MMMRAAMISSTHTLWFILLLAVPKFGKLITVHFNKVGRKKIYLESCHVPQTCQSNEQEMTPSAIIKVITICSASVQQCA